MRFRKASRTQLKVKEKDFCLQHLYLQGSLGGLFPGGKAAQKGVLGSRRVQGLNVGEEVNGGRL